MTFSSWAASPLLMQLPGGGGSNAYTLGWVELDGYDVFQVAAPSSTLGQRRSHIHQNLLDIRNNYLQMETPAARISTQETENGQFKVLVNDNFLMIVTQEDANLQGTTVSGVVERVEQAVPAALQQSYRERQLAYQRQQFMYAGGAIALAIFIAVLAHIFSSRLLLWGVSALGPTLSQNSMTADQRHHLDDIKQLLLPVFQFTAIAIAAVWTLGRFPETRPLQNQLLSTLKVPVIITIVVVVAYVGIRLTYAIVDQLLMQLTDEEGFSGYYSRRTRLRISTLSSVIKNIANFVWIALGFIVALSVTGINLGLLLASVGIIGLAFSLATQNLVQGVIRGFFIVLEDQFAIGDVVKIDDDAGVVENLNLRITQLRDTSGRLITIPTSDINRVANYSQHWSQADLRIPVHYNADINKMLEVTREVGEKLKTDPDWQHLILEDPQILGVDDFDDSAIIIRVWIKTQPMKQWDVSREFRRRFKLAIEASGAEIPLPQRDVWLHPSDKLLRELQRGLRSDFSYEGTSQRAIENGKSFSDITDNQSRNVPESSKAVENGHDGE
ncbi:MAG: mechanosensitive ion channel family protein [Cyanobacteria bacterium P01_C01_bin.70]